MYLCDSFDIVQGIQYEESMLKYLIFRPAFP